MNEREKFIIRAILIYAMSNISDINEVFECDSGSGVMIRVNGDLGKKISDMDLEKLLEVYQ